jgi:ribosomal protein L37AE/L43A
MPPLPSIREIVTAWARAANPTPEQEALARERAATCDTCDEKSFVTRAKMEYFMCAKCGCPLSKKVFSPNGPDACPLKLWAR